jgi:hypothetical protein
MTADVLSRRRPRLGTHAAAWLCLIALTGGDAGTGQQRLTYREADLTLPGRVTECVIRDLDGDGRDDVFLVLGRRHCRLSVREDGIRPWTEEPEPFPPRAVGFDLGRLPGERRYSLAVFTQYGVTVVDPGRGSPRARPAPPDAATGDVFRTPLFHDPGDGGAPVVVASRNNGCQLGRIASRGEDGRVRTDPGDRLEFPVDHHLHISGGHPFDRIETETTIPAPVFGDVDGDGRTDVALPLGRRLDFFLRGPDGKLAERSEHSFPLPPRDVGTRILAVTLAPRLADLDGDGILDLVDIDANAGLIRVHLGPLTREAAERPHAILRLGRMILAAEVLDADGDGRTDLRVLTTERVTLLRGIRMFLTQRMAVRVLTLGQGEDGRFAARAEGTLDAQLPVVVDTSRSPPKARLVPLFLLDCDLDGDGRADPVLPRDYRRHLAVFRAAAPTGSPASEPASELALPRDPWAEWERLRAGDLDGDGRNDLLAVGWCSDRGCTVIRAWLSGPR